MGKTTRSFKYDLNQIPFDYTVEVRNRFVGLDLMECMMNYVWRLMTLYRRQGARPSPKKEMQKSKMALWGGLTNSCEKKRSEEKKKKRREAKAKEKRKDIPTWTMPLEQRWNQNGYQSLSTVSQSTVHQFVYQPAAFSLLYTSAPEFGTLASKINLHLINKVSFISIYY